MSAKVRSVDRLRPAARAVLTVVGFISAVFGLWAICLPEGFFTTIPGLATSGMYHQHLVGDVGLAFLGSGVLMCLGGAMQMAQLAVAGCVFPSLHAIFHVFVWVQRGCLSDAVTVFDFFVVVLPTALASASVLALPRRKHETSI